MGMRTLASAALVAAATLTLSACGGNGGSQDAGHDAGTGCIGFCNNGGTDAGADGGTDAGTHDGGNPDGGGNDGGINCYDGGLVTVTLQDLREKSDVCTLPFGAHVQVNDVVVHTVSFQAGPGTTGDFRADFWVSDPANPPYGIWISKFYSDPPGPYLPKVGDVLDVDGYFGEISAFTNPTGYRRQIASKKVGTAFLPLTLTVTDAGTPPMPEVVAPGMFGDADGGNARPNREFAGSRVYIQGPLEITNPSPEAFHRVSANPNDPTYYGFEVTGGILVNNSKTFRSDGGCPWRDVALDAGVNGQKVVFTQGISGVWDTFTFSACSDGGTDIFNCFPKEKGTVPGTNNNYTYVIYPQGCSDFAGGEVQ